MIRQFLITTALFTLMSKPAHAYIDPGTGSMMLQVALGFLLTGFFTFKLWVGKVTAFFKKEKKVDERADKPKEIK